VMSFAIPDLEWPCGGCSLGHMGRALPASCHQLVRYSTVKENVILEMLGCSSGWLKVYGGGGGARRYSTTGHGRG
jgi:hypothetical protein